MVKATLKMVVVLSTLCIPVMHAQQAGLSARTDSTNYRIGDWIILHVQGTVTADVDTIVAAVKDSVGSFAVLHAERDANKPSWTFTLMTIDSGKVFIPPVEFDYRVKGDTTAHKAYTNAISLNIAGVVVDSKGDIKDIKAPISAPWQFADLLPYLIALVVLSAAGYAYYYYRKKQNEKLAVVHSAETQDCASHGCALCTERIGRKETLASGQGQGILFRGNRHCPDLL